MEIITLEEFKEHSRIDFDDTDSEVQAKVDAANEYVAGFLDVDLIDTGWEPPEDLKQAALMICAHWYENREDTYPGSINEVPLDAQEILLNHRGWAF